MSHLGVIAFDDTTRAGVVRETLADAKSEGYLWLDGPLVVIEDTVGSVHIGFVPDFRKLGQTWGDSGGHPPRPACFPKFPGAAQPAGQAWDAPVHTDQVMNSGVKVGVRGSWLGLRVGFL